MSRIIIADTDVGYIIPLQLKFAEDFFEKVDFIGDFFILPNSGITDHPEFFGRSEHDKAVYSIFFVHHFHILHRYTTFVIVRKGQKRVDFFHFYLLIQSWISKALLKSPGNMGI